jgi:hypothetical protein
LALALQYRVIQLPFYVLLRWWSAMRRLHVMFYAGAGLTAAVALAALVWAFSAQMGLPGVILAVYGLALAGLLAGVGRVLDLMVLAMSVDVAPVRENQPRDLDEAAAPMAAPVAAAPDIAPATVAAPAVELPPVREAADAAPPTGPDRGALMDAVAQALDLGPEPGKPAEPKAADTARPAQDRVAEVPAEVDEPRALRPSLSTRSEFDLDLDGLARTLAAPVTPPPPAPSVTVTLPPEPAPAVAPPVVAPEPAPRADSTQQRLDALLSTIARETPAPVRIEPPPLTVPPPVAPPVSPPVIAPPVISPPVVAAPVVAPPVIAPPVIAPPVVARPMPAPMSAPRPAPPPPAAPTRKLLREGGSGNYVYRLFDDNSVDVDMGFGVATFASAEEFRAHFTGSFQEGEFKGRRYIIYANGHVDAQFGGGLKRYDSFDGFLVDAVG